MADAEIDLDEDQYDSADDEDFTLDQAADEDDADLSSSDEETATEPAAKRRKTKDKPEDGPIQDADLDSGDEAMIRKAKEKKQKRGKKSLDDDEDEGGTGGFVKTRAMRLQIQEERKPLAKIDGATIDVDALWAQMNAPASDVGPSPTPDTSRQDLAKPADDAEMREEESTPQANTAQDKQSQSQHPDEMIKIKRTYKFAGEVITEEKLVPRDSAEAKLFLSGGQDGEILPATEGDIENGNADLIINFRRPLRKVSRFDPNPTGTIKKSWEKQPLTEASQENARGPKINTVEKSRMDWAAYVDQAGISDELRVHSKAKDGFLGRMDFLDRVDAKKEEERRNARLRGV
ncbi:bucentaur or craniofacial development-domain-containing protein [Aspergillus karnatakaensis]|uniref:putative Swr1p complex component (Swc5) n=1 Tax=Aspergillus karnatakaensis TaxID=1810916 RepID=UPI003CCD9702